MIWLSLLMLAVLIVLVLHALVVIKNIESEVRALMRLRHIENKLAASNQHARVWYSDKMVRKGCNKDNLDAQ